MIESAYELGLTRAEFFRLTPLDFARMSRAYERKLERDWLRTREIMAIIVNTTPRKDDTVVRGSDLIRLSFDMAQENRGPQPMHTPEEIERLTKLINAQ